MRVLSSWDQGIREVPLQTEHREDLTAGQPEGQNSGVNVPKRIAAEYDDLGATGLLIPERTLAP